MITAVDTNILIDILNPDEHHFQDSLRAFQQAQSEGSTVICEIVYAEIASRFRSRATLSHALATSGLDILRSTEETLWTAAQIWRGSRRGARGGRILPDFLIGAHAQVLADRLLTRARGFYRQCFTQLSVLAP